MYINIIINLLAIISSQSHFLYLTPGKIHHATIKTLKVMIHNDDIIDKLIVTKSVGDNFSSQTNEGANNGIGVANSYRMVGGEFWKKII